MNARMRHVIIGLCCLAIAGSIVAWAATGAHAYSRSRDTEIEAANASSDLSDLFGEATPNAAPPPEQVESVNAVGLVPSGPGRESISVLTISAPALVIIAVMLWLDKRTNKHKGTNP